jgi:hypothetical protein
MRCPPQVRAQRLRVTPVLAYQAAHGADDRIGPPARSGSDDRVGDFARLNAGALAAIAALASKLEIPGRIRPSATHGDDVVVLKSLTTAAGLNDGEAARTVEHLRGTLAAHYTDERGVVLDSRSWLITARRRYER